MTTTELANGLTALLKKYIKDNGYYSSGKLYKSISYKISDDAGGLSIDLTAREYIYYLDDGKLLNKFYSTKEVVDLFMEYTISKIERILGSIDI